MLSHIITSLCQVLHFPCVLISVFSHSPFSLPQSLPGLSFFVKELNSHCYYVVAFHTIALVYHLSSGEEHGSWSGLCCFNFAPRGLGDDGTRDRI